MTDNNQTATQSVSHTASVAVSCQSVTTTPQTLKTPVRASKPQMGALPQIVVSDTDLVALVRRHREALGLAQFTIDMDAGLQDGYTSKIEGPGRSYGRRPTKLTYPLSISFDRETGKMVSVGRINTDRPNSPSPILTAPAEYWLQALGLALVIMPRDDALAMTQRAIPTQIPIGPARSGRRVRRLSVDLIVSGIEQEPMPLGSVEPAVLRDCARAMAKALKRGATAGIAKAMRKAQKAGIDHQALSMAVQMNQERALDLSGRLARMSGYLHALNHPDVGVAVLDVVDHVRDEPESDTANRERAAKAWEDMTT